MANKTAGEKLKSLRQARNLSVESVCDSVFISKSSLRKYETNNRTPRDDVKRRLADFYGTTIGDIFFDD
ncbi:helix-turn-helix transcriptional regulator [uncultured Eubacterium sp.]|uniref:helix-turn-helix transcriptional regulator n=1 Tax=uncultured Eubacterium sp. TaxID=165185 RepID=UPI0025E4681D|nr:helix-turn-helix transcriptional regulator [uncultured Eubacterium sp.]